MSDDGFVKCELPVRRADEIEVFVLRNCETVRQADRFCISITVLTWKLVEEDSDW